MREARLLLPVDDDFEHGPCSRPGCGGTSPVVYGWQFCAVPGIRRICAACDLEINEIGVRWYFGADTKAADAAIAAYRERVEEEQNAGE